MKQPDPWAEIGPAGAGGNLSARRVDPHHPYHFFWARDASGRPALVLQHQPAAASDMKPPVLQGIEVIESERTPDELSTLLITLKRQEDREIFHHLCTDIIEAARGCVSESDAVREAIARTWKWHALLRQQSDGRLSPQAQQGLIGELLFLEKLLDLVAPAAALEFWRGPLDEPRDFVGNGNAVEVKARQAGLGHILISSEDQLADCSGELGLVCVEISPATSGSEGAFTLDDAVQRIGALVEARDPSAQPVFSALLAAAGWIEEHLYDDRHWVDGPFDAYAVGDGFPRITPAQLEAGISGVKYQLDLLACEPFRRSFESALSLIAGEYA